MMIRKYLTTALLLPVLCLSAGGNTPKAEVGSPLPKWTEGCLDIHAINSARGECTFFILPDGTTMTIDAGEFSSQSPKYANDVQRPDSFTRPTDTYARYMQHFMPADSLDYFLLTHFHMDHMGQIEPEYIAHEKGGYILSGITALYQNVPFIDIYDRAYPDYDSMAVLAMSTKALANYRRFIDYETANGTLKANRFELGQNQFKLKHAPDRYPGFSISNICANGYVWDGGKAIDCYNGAERRENGASCGILISYGDFDYFTAGDIGENSGIKGSTTQNTEYMSAKAIGRPIEAVKAHHHLSPHTMQSAMMEILQPDVMVTQSFYIREIQPDKEIIRRICDNGGTKMYFTNIDDSLVKADPEAYSRASAIGGHVVIRVLPGGNQYYVYVLDDTDTSYRVKQIDGPFNCKN